VPAQQHISHGRARVQQRAGDPDSAIGRLARRRPSPNVPARMSSRRRRSRRCCSCRSFSCSCSCSAITACYKSRGLATRV